jgi:DNA repair photolyase
MSGVSNPYQPIEKKLGITRQYLEVLLDLDLLQQLSQ